MPNDLIGSSLVQDQSERRIGLPHLTSDIVTAAQLIAETLTVGVDHQATNATQSLCSQELNLGLWIIWLNQACGVDLHPFQVNATSTNGLTHLDSITSGMVAVGGRQVQKIWPVFGQQGIISEVGAKAASGQNHWAFLSEILALLLVDNAAHATCLCEQLLDLCLVDDSCQVAALGDLFNHLDESICDGHSGETLLATMSAGSGMSTQSGQQGHVKVKFVHQPVNVRTAVSTQHLHQLRLLGATLQGVRGEELD
mmetsp:Transcript_108864/g.152211  ORF Transcript_108864/g.152211 Transcript_108864/m.152211 type:complete len:254 (-) Transcript_108864:19-780(-)